MQWLQHKAGVGSSVTSNVQWLRNGGNTLWRCFASMQSMRSYLASEVPRQCAVVTEQLQHIVVLPPDNTHTLMVCGYVPAVPEAKLQAASSTWDYP